jgi:hypothetical protein
MKLSTALLASQELTLEIDRDIDGLKFSASDRARLSAALLDQVHEHHKAFRLLLNNGLCGSASALVRVIFETMIHGVWIYRCASDEELERFKTDKIKGLDKLITDIESIIEMKDGGLGLLKNNIYSQLCSYTHGGYLQAVRRISSDEISPTYSEEEMLEALRLVDFCLLFSTIEIFSLANRQDLSEHYAKNSSMGAA